MPVFSDLHPLYSTAIQNCPGHSSLSPDPLLRRGRRAEPKAEWLAIEHPEATLRVHQVSFSLPKTLASLSILSQQNPLATPR